MGYLDSLAENSEFGSITPAVISPAFPSRDSAALPREEALSSPVDLGNAQFLLCHLDDGPDVGQNIIREWFGFVGFQNMPCLIPCSLVDISSPQFLPLFSYSPVNEFGMRLRGPHEFERVVMAEEVTKRPYFSNDVDRKSLVIDGDALHRMLDHSGEFIIHDQLPVTHCDARFKHSQAVYQVGPCQRWK